MFLTLMGRKMARDAFEEHDTLSILSLCSRYGLVVISISRTPDRGSLQSLSWRTIGWGICIQKGLADSCLSSTRLETVTSAGEVDIEENIR